MAIRAGAARMDGERAGGGIPDRERRRRRERPRRVLVTLALTVTGILGAACSSGSSASSTTSSTVPSSPTVTTFAGNGSYAVGTARYTLANGDQVQVWYPVDKASVKGKPTYTADIRTWVPAAEASSPLLKNLPSTIPTDAYESAPIATDTASSGDRNGAFPVLLFSHGYGSFPEQSEFLTDHLASWGFVIAAPDHRSRDLAAVLSGTTATTGGADVADLSNTLTFLHQQASTPGSRFYHVLDLAKIGVFGHSAGGGAAITFAGNPAVATYAALAPAPGTPPATAKPGLVMYGTGDTVVAPASVQALYATLPSPKRIVAIATAGHNVFDNICEITNGKQRLVQLLQAAAGTPGGLGTLSRLATDGCFAPDVSPPAAWPLIDQAVTAQMRYGLGIDSNPSGLGPGLDHAFPGVTATYSSTP